MPISPEMLSPATLPVKAKVSGIGLVMDTFQATSSPLTVPSKISVELPSAPCVPVNEPPRVRIEAVRSVDMASSNAWAEFAALFRTTKSAYLDHERAKTELKGLMPEDAREAFGHGVRAKRSKSGAVSFEAIEKVEASDAPVE